MKAKTFTNPRPSAHHQSLQLKIYTKESATLDAHFMSRLI